MTGYYLSIHLGEGHLYKAFSVSNIHWHMLALFQLMLLKLCEWDQLGAFSFLTIKCFRNRYCLISWDCYERKLFILEDEGIITTDFESGIMLIIFPPFFYLPFIHMEMRKREVSNCVERERESNGKWRMIMEKKINWKQYLVNNYNFNYYYKNLVIWHSYWI